MCSRDCATGLCAANNRICQREVNVTEEYDVGDVVSWPAKKKLGGKQRVVSALGIVKQVGKKWVTVTSWGVDWRVKMEDMKLVAKPVKIPVHSAAASGSTQMDLFVTP